jgi:hypothetical protein
MKRGWALFLAVSLGLAFAWHWGSRLLVPPPPLREERFLPTLFPEAAEFRAKEGNPPRYTALAPDDRGTLRPIGIAFLTTDVLPGVRGYAGPIHVLVGLGLDGKIAGIRVVGHAETPSYVSVIDSPAFGGAYAGRSPAEGFVPGTEVDAISRATITTEAIARSVRDASRIMGREALGLDLPPPGGEKASFPARRVAVVAAFILAALLLGRFGLPRLRLLFALAATALLGFWLGAYLSLGQAANLALGRGAPLLPHLDWYLLALFAVVASLTLGNLFCARLCPFGATSDLLRMAGARFGVKACPRWPQAGRLRWFYTWAVLLVAFAFGWSDTAGYEPFAALFDRKGTLLRWSLLAVVLAASFFTRRFWCHTFCPIGALLEKMATLRKSVRHLFIYK